MATNRSTVPPEQAWKLGRGSTIPVSALWTLAGGALINTVGVGDTGTLVLGGVTAVVTAATAGGMAAKGINEKTRGLPGVGFWQNAYVTACTAACGSWITWAAAGSPWQSVSLGAWAAGTIAGWVLYPWYRSSRRDAIAAEHANAHPTTAERDLTDWEGICEKAGLRGMTEHAARIDTPGGYVVRLMLPEHGRVPFSAFHAKLPSLSVVAGHKLGLRSGALRAEPGMNDAEVLLHVTERDVLAELIPLPDDLTLIDSNSPFDIGLHEDATELNFDFLRHGMVVGITDSGKSNTLNAIIKKGAQCVDVLMWVIDPKGGRMIRPWMKPLFDGRIKRPILDWVATNGGPTTMGTYNAKGELVKLNKSPDEYHHLLDTAVAEMERRSNLALGGEKVHTSPDLPRIVIIIDEAADVLGDRDLLEKCKLIIRKGRSEGIILLIAGQRGTASMLGDGDFRSQILNAIGLGVRSDTDARMVFPDDTAISKLLKKLEHQGTMLVKCGAKGRVIPGKGYRIDPDNGEIDRLAVALSGRRPGLPQDAADFHGSVYTDRWSTDRIGHLFVTATNQLRKAGTTTAQAAPQGPAFQAPGRPAADTTDRSGNRRAFDRFVNRGKNPTPPSTNDPITLSAEGEAIAADFQKFLAEHAPQQPTSTPSPAAGSTPGAEPGLDPRRALIRTLVHDAGPAGLQTDDLWAALTRRFGNDWNRSVVTTWITEDCRTGLMHRPTRGRVAPGAKPLDEQAGE